MNDYLSILDFSPVMSQDFTGDMLDDPDEPDTNPVEMEMNHATNMTDQQPQQQLILGDPGFWLDASEDVRDQLMQIQEGINMEMETKVELESMMNSYVKLMII